MIRHTGNVTQRVDLEAARRKEAKTLLPDLEEAFKDWQRVNDEYKRIDRKHKAASKAMKALEDRYVSLHGQPHKRFTMQPKKKVSV